MYTAMFFFEHAILPQFLISMPLGPSSGEVRASADNSSRQKLLLTSTSSTISYFIVANACLTSVRLINCASASRQDAAMLDGQQ